MSASPFRALVVEDDPIARQMVCYALEQEDFRCRYAADGAEALEQVSSEQFDLVVTDLRMPKKHGHALAVELLALDNRPVIVVHTAVDDPRLTKDLMMRGVDDVQYKPTNYPAFAAKVKILVQRKQALGGSQAQAPEQDPEASPALAPAPTDADEVLQSTNATAEASDPVDAAGAMQGDWQIQPIGQAEYERRLAGVQHLFPLSTAAYDVYVLSTSDNTTTGKLVSTMLQDAVLTADILRLANSAYYNRHARPTIDVDEAVVRIGFKKVGEVALALNALGVFRNCIVPWLDAELGQARSLAASIALEHLCERVDFRTANDGMTLCAFLHPLGRLALGSAFQHEYRTLIRTSLDERTSLSEIEAQVFPESHSAALGRVLSQWNVPTDIWGNLYHLGQDYDFVAQLEEPLRRRVELIKLAIFIGEMAVGRWAPWDEIAPPSPGVLARFQLTNLAALINQTRSDLGQVNEARRVATGDSSADKDLRQQPAIATRFGYIDLSERSGGWLPGLLGGLGMQTRSDMPTTEVPAGQVINAVHAPAEAIAEVVHHANQSSQSTLLVTGRQEVAYPPGPCQVVSLPASVAALQSAIDAVGKSPGVGGKALPAAALSATGQ